MCITLLTVTALCQRNSPSLQQQDDRRSQSAGPKDCNNGQAACYCPTAPNPQTDGANWRSVLGRPEWWVVIIAALTGISVAWQSFETRRAAQAMKTSNQANIWSQRARLSIRHEHRDVGRGLSAYRVFQLIATNFGLSMAEILEVDTKLLHFGHEIFKHLETMDFPAPTPNRFREPHILSAGEHWRFAEETIGQVVEPGSETEIESGRQIPVWYGWIMFRDLAGQVHRRKFFFMFSGRNRTFFELGPHGWNSED